MKHTTLVQKVVDHAGSQAELARRVSKLRGRLVRQGAIAHWIAGTRPVTPQVAHELEKISDGFVLRVDFYPKLFGDLQKKPKRR